MLREKEIKKAEINKTDNTYILFIILSELKKINSYILFLLVTISLLLVINSLFVLFY